MLKKFQKKEYLVLGAVLLVFLLMALYKLTDAPLWYDEMIEFYYSKYLTGQIRGVSLCNNLYERLQTNSFQPPLYNLIMYGCCLVSLNGGSASAAWYSACWVCWGCMPV